MGLIMFISKKKRQAVGKRCNNLQYSPTKNPLFYIHSAANSLAWVHLPSSNLHWSSCGAGAFPYLGAGPWDTVVEISTPSPGAIPRHPEGPWEGKEDSPACPRDSSKHGSTDTTSRANVTWNHEIKSARKPWIQLCSGHPCPCCRALWEERQGTPHARCNLVLFQLAPR